MIENLTHVTLAVKTQESYVMISFIKSMHEAAYSKKIKLPEFFCRKHRKTVNDTTVVD